MKKGDVVKVRDTEENQWIRGEIFEKEENGLYYTKPSRKSTILVAWAFCEPV